MHSAGEQKESIKKAAKEHGRVVKEHSGAERVYTTKIGLSARAKRRGITQLRVTYS